MAAVTRRQIDERLRHLPPEKLAVVYDFVSYLLERDPSIITLDETPSQATAFASEASLRQDWDQPEEDVAWNHL